MSEFCEKIIRYGKANKLTRRFWELAENKAGPEMRSQMSELFKKYEENVCAMLAEIAQENSADKNQRCQSLLHK